jgi:DNA-binding NarL/FixJ family response regulator
MHLEFLAAIGAVLPGLPLVSLAASSDPGEILLALSAGATGFVMKSAPPHQLVSAIRTVLQDGTFLCSEARQAVLTFFHARAGCRGNLKLTLREREVCTLLLLQSKKEAAARLNLATKTIEVLADRAFKKLGVHNRDALYRALASLR